MVGSKEASLQELLRCLDQAGIALQGAILIDHLALLQLLRFDGGGARWYAAQYFLQLLQFILVGSLLVLNAGLGSHVPCNSWS